MNRIPPGGLLALSPGDLTVAAGERFLRAVRACVDEGGLRAVLLREPSLADGACLRLLQELVALRTERPALWVGVHDRAHLAVAAGADGVHLGFRSLPVTDARRVVGTELVIGVSTHAGDPPKSYEGADYALHGPVHDTPSKRGWKDPVGFDGLRTFVRSCGLPVWGIGGLVPKDAASLRAAGAAGAAALSGVLGSADPVGASAAWRDAWPAAVEAER